MSAKLLAKMWKDYPESHLHCDVTLVALHTYQIVASLVDREGVQVTSIILKGSGNLNKLKDQAFGLLAAEVETLPTA